MKYINKHKININPRNVVSHISLTLLLSSIGAIMTIYAMSVLQTALMPVIVLTIALSAMAIWASS